MSGAWELEAPSVLVAILTRGIVPTKWAIGYRDLQLPSSAKPIFLSGMPFDHARNSACETFLRHGFQWLFFLDDDVVPPPDAYFKLSSRGADIISGLYYRRMAPIEPVALVDVQGGRTYAKFEIGHIVEVGYVGAGCLLIHRRVIENLKKPWFEWLMDHDDLPENQKMSEDFAFCVKARQNGYKIYLDTNVQCLHIGQSKSEVGNRYSPCDI